jgi:hypothetical protein
MSQERKLQVGDSVLIYKRGRGILARGIVKDVMEAGKYTVHVPTWDEGSYKHIYVYSHFELLVAVSEDGELGKEVKQ